MRSSTHSSSVEREGRSGRRRTPRRGRPRAPLVPARSEPAGGDPVGPDGRGRRLGRGRAASSAGGGRGRSPRALNHAAGPVVAVDDGGPHDGGVRALLGRRGRGPARRRGRAGRSRCRDPSPRGGPAPRRARPWPRRAGPARWCTRRRRPASAPAPRLLDQDDVVEPVEHQPAHPDVLGARGDRPGAARSAAACRSATRADVLPGRPTRRERLRWGPELVGVRDRGPQRRRRYPRAPSPRRSEAPTVARVTVHHLTPVRNLPLIEEDGLRTRADLSGSARPGRRVRPGGPRHLRQRPAGHRLAVARPRRGRTVDDHGPGLVSYSVDPNKTLAAPASLRDGRTRPRTGRRPSRSADWQADGDVPDDLEVHTNVPVRAKYLQLHAPLVDDDDLGDYAPLVAAVADEDRLSAKALMHLAVIASDGDFDSTGLRRGLCARVARRAGRRRPRPRADGDRPGQGRVGRARRARRDRPRGHRHACATSLDETREWADDQGLDHGRGLFARTARGPRRASRPRLTTATDRRWSIRCSRRPTIEADDVEVVRGRRRARSAPAARSAAPSARRR